MARASVILRSLVALSLGLAVVGTADHADAQRRRRGDQPGRLVLLVPEPLHGSEILVDEESRGFAPLEPISLAPGSHSVRVRRPGFTEFDGVVEIAAGQEAELMVEMIALSMVVTVRSTPDEARVFVDGTFRGSTPLELELTEGEHSIRVTSPRFHENVQTLNAVAGQTTALDVELEAIPEELLRARALEWYEEPLTWILIGSGVAALTAVAITLAVVLGANAYDGHCGAAPDRSDCLLVIEAADIGWQF